MMRRAITTAEVERRAGLRAGLVNDWLFQGYIAIEDPGNHAGVRRLWRPNEVENLLAIGRVIEQAKDAGLIVRPTAIRDMWAARTQGLGWRVTLDTGKATPPC